MPFIRVPPTWQLPARRVTSEANYRSRRQFLQQLAVLGLGASALPLAGCRSQAGGNPALAATYDLPAIAPVQRNSQFQVGDRPVTTQVLASQYNNFYEFGGSKTIWPAARALPTDPWQVEVSGLVKSPRTYALEDFAREFDLEERIYRFRCVEAWSMVLPWLGFPMRALLQAVEPTGAAQFVRFTSFYDPEITTGPGFHLGRLPWPYTESLRLEEMANELAFFALGLYGKALPKQHGAPIRAVIPWKYGFKGAKSIVKIEFVATQPATYWHTLVPNEYDYEANVNPDQPHPRWSQAQERFIGTGTELNWEWRETLPYNGYGEWVAGLYT